MLRTYSSTEAMENSRANPFSRWGPPLEQRERRVDPAWANARLQSDVFETLIKPSFRLKRGDMIYASGSCFAQNIELNLLQSGMDLLYSPKFFDAHSEFKDIPQNVRRSVLTMYNTPSIMRFAHDFSSSDVLDKLAYEVKPDQYIDCTIGGVPAVSLDLLLARRAKMRERLAALKDVSCVIFTLGLSEVWYDKIEDDYLNYLPDLRLIRKEPDRFELRVLDFNQTYDYLATGIDALHDLGVRNIVITVSPVPLIATFTDQDIVVANEYSKSVLHAAAQTICVQKHCDYFPSYELVRYAPASMAWEHDRRHPTSAIVSQVTRLFAQHYIED